MADPLGGAGLLERAIGYARGGVAAVGPDHLARPTPCSDWNLRMLLEHLNDSLATLHDAVRTRWIAVASVPEYARPEPAERGPADLAATFRDRAGRLLGAWSAAGPNHRMLAVGDRPLPASVMAGAGAVELAVHGWDVFRACGRRRPIPPPLAADLLRFARLVVTDATRNPQFAAPVVVSPLASPSDRLVAFLGRSPGP
jgi:uncharacterized protein (TIGR03086 family)